MMSCLAITSEVIAISRGLFINVLSNGKHTVFEAHVTKKKEDEDSISDIVLSSDSKLLAIITSSSKELLVYRLPDLSTPLRFSLPRSASKIRFTDDNIHILVADKSGDALMYDISESGSSGTKILGHLSLLLDILETYDKKFIITSDRDEKIRVSCNPNTYNIQTYCLGHKEYVNHIELLPHNKSKLISSSGDGTVKIWDYREGNLLDSIDTNADLSDKNVLKEFIQKMDSEGLQVTNLPVLNCTVTKLSEMHSFVAVLVHNTKEILLYTVADTGHELTQRINLDTFPTTIVFHELYLYVYNESSAIVYKYKYDNEFKLDCEYKFFEGNPAINVSDCYESIKLLFKRKFDNVQEYQERKKQRLEKGQ